MRARAVVAFVAGVIFAAGLVIGGMAQPSKIVGFLDFFGDWDPSLVLVMAGAVAVHSAAYWMVARRQRFPLFDEKLHVPSKGDITPRLVVGAALFGIGWGLGGYCPGPGIAAAPSMAPEALTFFVTMSGGIFAYDIWRRTRTPSRQETP